MELVEEQHEEVEIIPPTVQQRRIFEPMCEQARIEKTDIHGDDWCPLHRFIGNDKARSRLARACFSALMNEDHNMSEFSFALLGPASAGKTTLAKLLARTVQLPFVEVEPKSVKTTDDLLEKISDVVQDIQIKLPDGTVTTMELVPVQDDDGDTDLIVLPPMIVFIDEVHNLSNGLEQGLLKATEKNDGMMVTSKWRVDCRNVCWVIATTERGKLFGPFDTRFTKITLNLYTESEMAEIVFRGMEDQINMEACKLVAKYAGRVPREAIAFAKEMRAERRRNTTASWEDCAKIIADEMEIDEFGMTSQRLRILKALGQGPMSKNRLCNVARCQIEELERFVLPSMLADSDEMPSIISINSSGCIITDAGRLELDKRGIEHKPYGD